MANILGFEDHIGLCSCRMNADLIIYIDVNMAVFQ